MDRHRLLIDYAARVGAAGSRNPYWRKVVNRVGSGNVIGYWPLDDASGSTARDLVGGLHGAYTGLALADGVGPCGHKVPYSLEITDKMLVNAAGLAAAWAAKGAGAKGAVGGWAKVKTTWATANFVNMFIDSSNRIVMGENAGGSLYATRIAGGTANSGTLTTGLAEWFHLCLTWSEADNRVRYYLNGMLMETDTPSGTWTGNLPSLQLFGNPSGALDGWMSDWFLVGGYEPTIGDIRSMISAAPAFRPYHLAVLGDSITSTNGYGDWVFRVVVGTAGRIMRRTNHAVAGNSIMSGMDAQVLAAAADNADGIIIALGTNDNNSGDMNALQAEAEENIAELRASNPGAALYWLNVLPCWTDNVSGPEVDKSNTRAAIAAACTAQGITCWDTYADPWIAQNETTDGLHPSAAANAAIAAQVLARL